MYIFVLVMKMIITVLVDVKNKKTNISYFFNNIFLFSGARKNNKIFIFNKNVKNTIVDF